MDPIGGYVTQVRCVGLIFLGFKDNQDPVYELETIESSHTHEQKHAKQNRHWNVGQSRSKENR